MKTQMKLYGYWRSSAAYRVRIALNLKGIDVSHHSVHLVKDGGQQHFADYVALNPQQLVPVLVINAKQGEPDQSSDIVLSQSLAIIEYLEECYPQTPLLPNDPVERAIVRMMAMAIAMETHPLNNLRVLQYLSLEMGVSDEHKNDWYHHWVHQGFSALEAMLVKHSGRYCFKDSITLADLCLVPQVYNAQRFSVNLDNYPNIMRIWQNCNTLGAFQAAMPEAQADAM